MPGRGFRFVLEVAYLGALAAALAFTTVNAALVVAAMLGGWLLLAGVEWAAVSTRPHYAAGLPPRWYVPSIALPPAQPLEQVVQGYPEPDLDEGATWIASAAVRDELLSEWPLLIDPEDTQEAQAEDWGVVRLPEPEPDPDPEPEPEPVVAAAAPEARTARYHVDPFAEPERGRFGRRQQTSSLAVPAKPPRPPHRGAS